MQGVDRDDLEPLKQLPVVDLVVASLEEVVLIRVVVFDNDKPSARLLTKEGASMGIDTIILTLGAKYENFPVSVRGLKLLFHKRFES